ncbi:Guanylate-binding protein [Klebsormidium nitens]|uniref:Guanylate-binding protein n=1 Tax=Klebsormidium nitens TaxID=105231 RepID=A0A1Y1IAM1_KLENI|nr:Guanylate-binding protein [Klebsormidium nitens]|eukprot:GAQ88014.1 Guanylate-binding protein [Klebsormidium nitens]
MRVHHLSEDSRAEAAVSAESLGPVATALDGEPLAFLVLPTDKGHPRPKPMFGWGRGGQQSTPSKMPGTPNRPPGKQAKQPPASQTPAVAQPLRLLYCDDSGKFVVEPAAIRALQAVKGPVGVVAVCGRARQGKSFILNQLLGRTSGFAVAPTHRPCTKGLWMWSQPVARTAADGSTYHLVLLDSEGIDAYDQTGTYSVQIFSLAVLLSSMFVYNQMGGIDEAALDRLSLVTEMTHHIRVKAAGGDADPAELGPFSPSFLWLLRDFYLDLSEDGRAITPRDYLESALQPTPGNSKAVHAKNQIRESIRALFPRRDCFTLVRPVHDEQQLQRLDSLPPGVLRPEFQAGLEALTSLIFEKTRPKQMEGAMLTGPMLAALAQSFVGAINEGAVPTIATAWQSVAEGECRRAYDSALAAYSTSFDRSTPPEEGPLAAAHSAAVDAALGAFSREAVGSAEVRQPFETRLRAELGKQFEEYRGRVLVEAELACTRAISALDARLAAAAGAPGARLEQVVAALAAALQEYDRAAAGPGKAQAVVTYLQESLARGPLHRVVEQERAAATDAYKALEAQLRSVTSARDAAEKEAAANAGTAEDARRQWDAEASARREAEARAAAALERAHKEAREREERQATGHHQTLAGKESELRSANARLREKEGEVASLAAQLKGLEGDVRRLETSLASRERSSGQALDEARQRAAQLAAEKAEAEGARAAAESGLRRARDDAARLEETVRALEGDKARLVQEKQDAQDSLAASEAAERASAQRLSEMKKDMEALAARGQGVQRTAARVAEVEQQLQDSRASVTRLELEAQRLRADVARLQEEQRAREAEQLDLNARLGAATQARAALEQQVQTLTAERQVLDERIARHGREAAQAQANGAAVGGGPMDVDMETPEVPRKRARTEAAGGPAPAAAVAAKGGGDPIKKTVAQLKMELTAAGYATEILAVKNISKKDLVKLYQEKGLGG